jgi:hypothetical protein
VLEEEEDLAEGIISLIEKSRPSQKVLGLPSPTTLTQMRRGMDDSVPPKGPPTSRTEGRVKELNPAPAPSTDDRPRSDPENVLTERTPGREQEPEEGEIEFQAPPLRSREPHVVPLVEGRSQGRPKITGGENGPGRSGLLALLLLLA